MDFLSLKMSTGGFRHILVIMDHFTSHAHAVLTKNQSAKIAAQALFNNFLVHYRFPRRLHSDKGTTFESEVIREVCQMTGMDKSWTTPYHPMRNGTAER